MKKIILLLAATLFIAAFATLTPSPAVCSWDFRGSLWGPAYMLLHGGTPYTHNTPYGPYAGIWMPQLIGAFFPLGWLPCWVAAKLWFLSEIAGLFAMIWLVAGHKLPAPWLFGAGLLLIFLFPPLYTHLIIGQISIFITVLLMLVVFQFREEPAPGLHWWAPLFLAIALAKPQLGVLVYPGLLVWAFRKGGYISAGKLMLYTALWVLVLIVPVTLIDPAWPKGFLDITLGNTQVVWDLPNPFVQLKVSLGMVGILLWALIFLGCLGFTLWLWRTQDARLALLWSLALTPIATPYCSSWDFMLMVPLLLWLLIHTPSNLARLALILGALAIDGLQFAARLRANIPDGENWWVSIALLGVMALALGIQAITVRRSDPLIPANIR